MTKSNIESLWPEDLVGVPETTPPVTILRQQATMLGQLTQNILEGEVASQQIINFPGSYVVPREMTESALADDITPTFKISKPSRDNNGIAHSFYIKAPALGGYRYRLFSVSHSLIAFYPLGISGFVPIEGAELEFPPTNDEDTFRKVLKEIFNHPRTKKIIQSLMAQSISDTAS